MTTFWSFSFVFLFVLIVREGDVEKCWSIGTDKNHYNLLVSITATHLSDIGEPSTWLRKPHLCGNLRAQRSLFQSQRWALELERKKEQPTDLNLCPTHRGLLRLGLEWTWLVVIFLQKKNRGVESSSLGDWWCHLVGEDWVHVSLYYFASQGFAVTSLPGRRLP